MSEIGEPPFEGRRANDQKLYSTDTLRINTETPTLNVASVIERAKNLSGTYLHKVVFDPGEVSGNQYSGGTRWSELSKGLPHEGIFWVELAKNIARTEGILRTTMDPIESDSPETVSSKTDLFKLALVNTDAILAAKNREKQLLGELYTDALTGLPNRKYVEDIMSKRIQDESAKGKKFMLLRLDIDTFKVYNDEMSHEYGDDAIRAAGQILYLATRSSDLAVRMSGDEFIILLEDTEDEGALKVANRIQGLVQADSRLKKPKGKQVTEESGSVSIGIASSSGVEGGITFAELDRRADAAAYASKKAGKARSTVYQDGMEDPPKQEEPPID